MTGYIVRLTPETFIFRPTITLSACLSEQTLRDDEAMQVREDCSFSVTQSEDQSMLLEIALSIMAMFGGVLNRGRACLISKRSCDPRTAW